MSRWVRVGASGVLGLHGLVHLMGTFAYLRLVEVAGLPYKTTVLGGALDLGATGTAAFAVGWGVAALGFAAAAVGLIARRRWWSPLLLWTTLFSLGLTGLDWGVAATGVVVNLAVLLALLVRTTLRSRLSSSPLLREH
jgi:hypothetical protein